MPTQNRWSVGSMYFNGASSSGAPGFFTQPGGPGTQVFPTQQSGTPWADYPVPGLVIQEYNPWWSPGCLHSIKFWLVIREYDYDTESSVALVCCSICSFVQSTIEPFEEWLNPVQRAIIVS